MQINAHTNKHTYQQHNKIVILQSRVAEMVDLDHNM